MSKPVERFSWMALLLLGAAPGCGTDAVGVEACREVEYARCQAAVHCGLIDDAAACQHYYRDHCLHGVRLEEAPSSVDIRQCVEVIEAAGECADDEGARTAPEECGDRDLEDTRAARVCDIVEEPQRAPACAFLDVEPEPDDDETDDEETDDRDQDEESDQDPDAGANGGD